MKRLGVALALVLGLVALAGLVLWGVSEGVTGVRHPRGVVAPRPIPPDAVALRAELQRAEASAVSGVPEASTPPRQILFGDLHVHTTYSSDAFVFSLPLLQGEGVHPPADACDFARFCAELDFWSINDHAEHLTPWQWAETRASIRECNAVAGDAAEPDLVSFLGWEWTQSRPRGRGEHYGHKNVIVLGTEEGEVPTRPIGAGRGGVFALDDVSPAAFAAARIAMTWGDWPGNLRPYLDFNRYSRDVRALASCPEGVPVRELPGDCLEGAETPERLFAKLDDWGFESLVIPHGTAWGIHAPPEADLAAQLAPGMHDARRQRLLEVYSGHGSSEAWRELVDVETGAAGSLTCAAPRDGYEPCCWRAGEIIRARCGDAPADVCEQRVRDARQGFVDAGARGPRASGVVPGATPADWGECGQLTGSFLPAYEYRPRMSAQYGLAVRPQGAGAGDDGAFRFGLIGSSDNHKARAGPGYKEMHRKAFGDAYGLRRDWLERLGQGPRTAAAPAELPAEPLRPEAVEAGLPLRDPGTERNASYYYTAGLVAVHAEGRSREAIFSSLRERRAYATSGPRILLWFTLENGPQGPAPMGSEVAMQAPPRFSVRALGDFVQQPGCPDYTRERLGPERMERLCKSECYHPGDRRHPIERIEIVRIRPQVRPDEPLGGLIEDPWRTFECPAEGEGCRVDFTDPAFAFSADPASDPSPAPPREHLYYARALQAPTLAVNGDPMRCTRADDGRCETARLCPAGGPDFEPTDDCLAAVRERAWSSPIWLLPTP